ncbi:glycosyltransferase family 2 protein [Sistotremastrum niveocremeum HHB9708]|uniref:chitin synthase n=1 Tax=Sistotremastrum niveocremeum HHB9708 TaxID=1314777 RepID=A0A164YHN0_9AGAM|nr:glycosyltransferase family 2 protein [Sistotremastrum niveocremeum HHB9708]
MSRPGREQSGSSSYQRLENETDLTKLPTISDDVILSCIRDRFMTDQIYTAIGTSAVVSINPYKYVNSSADAVMVKYAAEYRDTAEEKTYLPPHVFQLANNAYYHMRRTGQDQGILISGESGSGKSESRRLIIKSLLELSVSNPGKKGSKLSNQIPSAEFVLEAFGNARTLSNPNASRFGKYTELQFTDRGRVSGVKTLEYYLERSRVTGAPSGERNFHIFYYLIAGASTEERQHLHLHDKQAFRYLGQRAIPRNGGEDDGLRFEQLKMAMKSVGLSKRSVAQMCQLIAAILHLGNLEFTIDRHRNLDAAVVKNVDVLDIVADFLGVQPSALEAVFSYKTKLVKKELCTVFLDPEGAAENRDALAQTLYSLLFSWVNENINQRLHRDDFSSMIGLLDLPGPQNIPSSSSRSNSLDQFCVNYANEKLQNWIQKSLFESHVEEYSAEGISNYVPQVPYFDNSECVRLLENRPGGLIHIMDDQARKMPKKTEHTMVEAFGKRWGNHSSFKIGNMDRSGFPSFTVNHYTGGVTYSAEDFLEKNLAALNPDFVSLLRGPTPDAPANIPSGSEMTGSINPFVRGLFSSKAIATQAHPRNEDTIVAAQQPVKPMRAPSTRRKGTVRRKVGLGDDDKDDDEDGANEAKSGIACKAGEFRAALEILFQTFDETQPWFVFCLNPNDSQLPNQLEGRGVKAQIRSIGLSEIARRNRTVFEVSMTPSEFCERYRDQLALLGVEDGEDIERVIQARQSLGLQEWDLVQGQYKVFLSHLAFHKLEDHLRATDVEEQKRNRLRDAEAEAGLVERPAMDPYAPYSTPASEAHSPAAGYGDAFNLSSQQLPLVANAAPFMRADMYEEQGERGSVHSEDFDGVSRYTSHRDDTGSNFGSESYAPSRNMFQNADKKALGEKDALPGEIQEGEVTEEIRDTSTRRRWLVLVWFLTFWLPNPFLSWFGRMKRLDVRQAWREKLAINMVIWFICGCAVFVIAVLGNVICPREFVFGTDELASHSSQGDPNHIYTAIRGEVFDLSNFANTHSTIVNVVPKKSVLKYGGLDATDIFPVQVSALCDGTDGNLSPYIVLDATNTTDVNAQYHDFRVSTTDPRPDWYWENMVILRYHYRVGFMGYTPSTLRDMASAGLAVGVYDGLVYDLTTYINTGPAVRAPPGQSPPDGINAQFMAPEVVEVFKLNSGKDVTKLIDNLNINKDTLIRQKICLRNLFTIGKQDNRQSPQCLFSKYILLVLSIVMVSVIGFKFLAALQFGAPRAPEDHDKFIVCQVPCYTEGEESLRKTIDSLAKLRYDDKRKLLFIVCDGMIVGSGNDRPTPRIVLDILGADPNVDPEPLSFLSLGEGAKQHNMGKVYSGLYECSGHVVPYLVLVKVGKPTERQRPGNRGKRDSQMVLMHFLNKVHFNSPMNPLELEIYHQIKNVIGVNPSFYEYIFMVDADTTVDTMSLNRLVSAMVHDKKVLGVCGETSLANAKQSIITMMQVYEYFISHHLAKAFESLFGSVTCLPGCFTMYRLRTPDTHKPLFISNQVIQDYSENRVDTLHMKNLLHLGEDRYLTTLLLKHFPAYKTQFVRDAHAYTVAPDEWKILLSQRRRWINSTIHNLGELVFLERLCGFCCFSMRFIVFIDLLSTLVQPVSVAYIVYLIYLTVAAKQPIPTLSLIMLGAIYGLQALIFIFRRKWDMIGWMVFYILAIPAFSFFLPLYSFWKMDDFSWGATRVVLGEKGKKLIVHDEGKFDPRSIPLKSWNDYENELWDKESNHSIGSWVPPQKEFMDYDAHTASVYGRETFYDASQSRTFSPIPSQAGFAPPGYQSGRNSPALSARPASAHVPYGNAPSRPITNYLDVRIPSAQSTSGLPSDTEIMDAVKSILQEVNLDTVTKREIRQRLEDMFGCDLSSRKLSINAAIDKILLGDQ